MVCENAGQGRSEGPGKPTRPSDERDTADVKPGEKKAVPIGRPVTPERFEALKKAAKGRKRSGSGPAQEDPSED